METAENQIAFKEETLKEVGRVVAQYPEGMQKSALIRVLHLAPRAAVDGFGAELALSQRVGPVPEAAFRELHDVALVDDGHRGLVIVDGVLDRLAYQALGALSRHGLDANARGVGEADLLHAHFVDQ